jgi:peptidoglycan-associated lipoprotein
MKSFQNITLVLLLSSAMFLSGCSTISDWFGWGDEATPENIGEGTLPPATDSISPGSWGGPGAGVPGRPGEWTPIPGITLPTVYFAYDQAQIGASEQAKLEQVADYLLKNQNINLIIEGHCDERGSLEYNRALGERRAISVRDALVSLGVADARMQTLSYGEEKPAVQGSDENTWAKNRRAELIPAK